MTRAAVAAFALYSVAVVAFHFAAWLAAGRGDQGLGNPEGFFARIGWGLTTYLLGLLWMGLLLYAVWRVVRSARPRPLEALVIMACTVIAPLILSALVNVPYKGASATDFLDTFLQPGGITPGGNGTMQDILISAATGGIAAVQLAHALGRRRGVAS